MERLVKYKKTKAASIFVLLILLSIGFFQRHVLASVTVNVSSYTEIDSDIYIDNFFSLEEQISLAKSVENARERVTSKFGELISSPIIIASSNEARASRFFRNRVTPSVTYNLPWGQYIPLAPEGLNVDVIAHELVHAEIYHRLGYFKDIPRWFHEGAGMQVDYREDKAWTYIQNEIDLPPVSSLASNREFSTRDRALHYAASQVEVSSWLESPGNPGLYAFIDAIKRGEEFHALYERFRNTEN